MQVELLFNEVAYSVAIHVSDQRSAGEDAGTSSRILTVEVERSSDGEREWAPARSLSAGWGRVWGCGRPQGPTGKQTIHHLDVDVPL